jgi:lysozyme
MARRPTITGTGATRIARQMERFSDRRAPEPGTQALGLYVGVVMEDRDEQRMGRLMVYIPGFSSPHAAVERAPASSDQSTWFRVSPIVPFFGSDDYTNPDSRDGDSVSYGLWPGKPRVGDHVAIMFAGGDPSQGYWLGCVIKQYQNFMVPGMPEDTVEGSELELPGREINRDRRPARRKRAGRFADHLEISGLAHDPVRGAGTSSMTRETPSRVSGWKTPGDPNTGMMGHQIVMDDLADQQGIRVRTSRGNQILLSDAGRCVYVSTALGDTWIEIREDGHVDVFGSASVSVHARKDINLVAGRDLNIDVGRDLNVRVARDHRATIGQDMHLSVVRHSYDTIGAQYHLKSTGLMAVQTGAAYSLTSGGDQRFQASPNIYWNSGAGQAPTASVPPLTSQQPGPPSSAEISGGHQGQPVAYVAGQDNNIRVPQHEPWKTHDVGLVGVRESVAQGTAEDGIRHGATTPEATKPHDYVAPDGTIYRGQAYETDADNEDPAYSPDGSTSVAPASSYGSVSARGKELIKRFEGFSNRVYTDLGGKPTIGYGHLVKQSEIGQWPEGITLAEAEALLDQDLADSIKVVQRACGDANLTQNQFDALVSFTYNVGGSAFRSSTLLKKIRAGEYREVPEQLMRWVYVNKQPYRGLQNRRQAEADLFGLA